MNEYYVTVPYSVIKLGGLHIWTYIGMQADYPNGFGTSLRGYTPQTMAVKLGITSPKGINNVGTVLKDLSTLDFLEIQRQGSMYVIDTKNARGGDVEAPLWCIEKILGSDGNRYQTLQRYFKGDLDDPSLERPGKTTKLPWEDSPDEDDDILPFN